MKKQLENGPIQNFFFSVPSLFESAVYLDDGGNFQLGLDSLINSGKIGITFALFMKAAKS